MPPDTEAHSNVPAHMTPEAFRAYGKAVIDWIADYWRDVEAEPVLPAVDPGAILAQLPTAPPKAGEAWEEIIQDLDDIVMPGITHWQHPRFFAFFSANATGPAVLGDLVSSGLGVQGMLWQTSPACTEVEMRVLDWLAQLIGLPASFMHASDLSGGGVIQGTASESTLTAMVAARDSAIERLRARHEYGWAGKVSVYTSTQAHSSVLKAAQICGIGRDLVRLIKTDHTLAMDPIALQEAIRKDVEDGIEPAFVCATLGTTSTGAMDPLREICDAVLTHCKDAWVHVDAAWAGSAFVCPELRGPLDGIEGVDSFVFNPHKWLLTNFDCSAFYLNGEARRRSLIQSMEINPAYLRNSASDTGSVVDYRDWHIPLGRRFRSLKLWFVLRHYGAAGLQAFIRGHVELADTLVRAIDSDDRFKLVSRSLALVCVRVAPGHTSSESHCDELTDTLIDRVNAQGVAYFTRTVVPIDGVDRVVLRFNIGSVLTELEHVREGWSEITRTLDQLM